MLLVLYYVYIGIIGILGFMLVRGYWETDKTDDQENIIVYTQTHKRDVGKVRGYIQGKAEVENAKLLRPP